MKFLSGVVLSSYRRSKNRCTLLVKKLNRLELQVVIPISYFVAALRQTESERLEWYASDDIEKLIAKPFRLNLKSRPEGTSIGMGSTEHER